MTTERVESFNWENFRLPLLVAYGCGPNIPVGLCVGTYYKIKQTWRRVMGPELDSEGRPKVSSQLSNWEITWLGNRAKLWYVSAIPIIGPVTALMKSAT